MKTGLESIANAPLRVAVRTAALVSGFAFAECMVQGYLDNRLAYHALGAVAVSAAIEGLSHLHKSYKIVRREPN